MLVFSSDDASPLKRAVRIPYSSIVDLTYGQKAGRRVGVALGLTTALGPAGLLALMSKKRHHFLTVEYAEAGKSEVAVFEVGKDIVRSTLAVVEVRSGKKIAFQDDQARHAMGQ